MCSVAFIEISGRNRRCYGAINIYSVKVLTIYYTLLHYTTYAERHVVYSIYLYTKKSSDVLCNTGSSIDTVPY